MIHDKPFAGTNPKSNHGRAYKHGPWTLEVRLVEMGWPSSEDATQRGSERLTHTRVNWDKKVFRWVRITCHARLGKVRLATQTYDNAMLWDELWPKNRSHATKNQRVDADADFVLTQTFKAAKILFADILHSFEPTDLARYLHLPANQL